MDLKVIRILFVGLLLYAQSTLASERVFFEDCEDTEFVEYFLERSIGTSSYWDVLTESLTRSNQDAFSGQYCMTIDHQLNPNPHTNIGYPVDHGNTSNFLLRNVKTSTYYFKWKQRWQTGIDYSNGTMCKMLYLGYSTWGGDFSIEFVKNGSNDFHLSIFKNPGHELSYNKWFSSSFIVDDMNWHTLEFFIDLGSTGATGSFSFKIDGVLIKEGSGITFRDQININEGAALLMASIPANRSGDNYPSSARTWLDDIEIWDGLPDENPASPPAVVGDFKNE